MVPPPKAAHAACAWDTIPETPPAFHVSEIGEHKPNKMEVVFSGGFVSLEQATLFAATVLTFVWISWHSLRAKPPHNRMDAVVCPRLAHVVDVAMNAGARLLDGEGTPYQRLRLPTGTEDGVVAASAALWVFFGGFLAPEHAILLAASVLTFEDVVTVHGAVKKAVDLVQCFYPQVRIDSLQAAGVHARGYVLQRVVPLVQLVKAADVGTYRVADKGARDPLRAEECSSGMPYVSVNGRTDYGFNPDDFCRQQLMAPRGSMVDPTNRQPLLSITVLNGYGDVDVQLVFAWPRALAVFAQLVGNEGNEGNEAIATGVAAWAAAVVPAAATNNEPLPQWCISEYAP